MNVKFKVEAELHHVAHKGAVATNLSRELQFKIATGLHHVAHYGAQRRRIYTEQKAKVVDTAWRTDLIQFLAALAILHQDDLKNRMHSSFSSII